MLLFVPRDAIEVGVFESGGSGLRVCMWLRFGKRAHEYAFAAANRAADKIFFFGKSQLHAGDSPFPNFSHNRLE